MGRLDKIKKFFNRNTVDKGAQQFDAEFLMYLTGNNSPLIISDQQTPSSVINAYSNSVIYSAVNIKAKNARNIPMVVKEIQNDGSRVRVDFDHPLQQLLHRPNPKQSWAMFSEGYYAFGDLTGERYIYGLSAGTGIGNEQGLIRRLYLLPTPAVQANLTQSGQIRSYRNPLSIGNSTLDPQEVCAILDFNPDPKVAHYKGFSPLRALIWSKQINDEAIRTAASQLARQGPRGVWLPDVDGNKPFGSVKEAKAFMRDFNKTFNKGHANPKQFATHHTLQWQQTGVSLVDLAFIDVLGISKEEIANVLGVPVLLLDASAANTYANREEANRELFERGIIPAADTLAQELTAFLCTDEQYGSQYVIEADYSGVQSLQEDKDTILEMNRDAYYLTGNEKREALGYPPSDDPLMDEIILNRDYQQRGNNNQTPTDGN